MSNSHDYDLFVLGAGSGGVRAARMASNYGAKVGIAENRYLGGTCVNVGCVPKKLFVYGSHYSDDFADARGYGWDVGSTTFDWQRLRNNKTAEIQRLNGIYGKLLDGADVATFWGTAKLLDPHTVRIGGRDLTADKILIATGGWPVVPEFPGRELAITSNEAFYLADFPKRAVVVGGGYIGVEFAGIFQGLGAATTLLYRGDLFLRGFDQGVREFVRDELQHKGIDLQFNTNVQRIEDAGTHKIVHLTDGSTLEADTVLYATGRSANTQGFGFAEVGVKLADNGAVLVNDDFQTSVANIYAIGDVIDRLQLTPVAIREAMCLSNNLFTSNPKQHMDYANVATAVFCQPNIGTVGLTEEEAKDKFGKVLVFESSFRAMKHTLTNSSERTFMKLLVDAATDKVVGIHMAGPESAEIIQGLAVAVVAGLTKAQFDQTTAIHPTAAEEFVTMREPSREVSAGV